MTIHPDILALRALGMNVLPVRPGQKTPAIASWKVYQRVPVPDDLFEKWFNNKDRGAFVVTGQVSGYIVLDIDNPEGEEFWRNALGDLLDQTAYSTTGKGHHYWFRVPTDGIGVRSRSGQGWDLRAEGTGVVAPPSKHASGVYYAWDPARGPEAALPWPGHGESSEGARRSSAAAEAGPARSRLAELLASPPSEGNRNVWLTQAAGHYAKMMANKPDAYFMQVEAANNMLADPLPEKEWRKTAESVWREEQERIGQIIEASEQGYLVEEEGRLYTLTKTREQIEFGDFTLQAVGFSEEVGVLADLGNGTASSARRVVLSPGILADRQRFEKLLFGYGYSLGPGADVLGYGRVGGRIQRWLKAQNPPILRSMSCYDWDDQVGGFVTDDGVIKPGAVAAEPVPILVNTTDRIWHYGFGGTVEKAADVLREVLLWHDETVACVFGSWWAACLVKSFIEKVSSQFPIMALHAPSESGKSTGFFPAMVALNGNTVGAHDSTRAALRDSLAANRAGIVWVDDAGHPENFHDLIRQVTVGGSIRKKGVDMDQYGVRLVGPMLISGETIGVVGEKALLDRTITLSVPTPKGRLDPRSGRLQWEHIVEFRAAHPDLTEYAGLLLGKALEVREVADMLPSFRVGHGREADKWAVLWAGLQVLEHLAGADLFEGRGEEILRGWLFGQLPVGNDNALTLDFLPKAIMYAGNLNTPRGAVGSEPPTPAFITDKRIWFHPTYLAEWLVWITRGHVDPRVASAESLRQQAAALGITGGQERAGGSARQFRIGGGNRSWYWGLSEELSQTILRRLEAVPEDADTAAYAAATSPRMPGAESEGGIRVIRDEPKPTERVRPTHRYDGGSSRRTRMPTRKTPKSKRPIPPA